MFRWYHGGAVSPSVWVCLQSLAVTPEPAQTPRWWRWPQTLWSCRLFPVPWLRLGQRARRWRSPRASSVRAKPVTNTTGGNLKVKVPFEGKRGACFWSVGGNQSTRRKPTQKESNCFPPLHRAPPSVSHDTGNQLKTALMSGGPYTHLQTD